MGVLLEYRKVICAPCEIFLICSMVREHLEGKGEALREIGNNVIRVGKKQEVESHYF